MAKEKDNVDEIQEKPEELELMTDYIDDFGYFYDNPAEEYERNKKLKVGLTIRNIAVGLIVFIIGITCLGFFLRTMKYGARIVTQETISEVNFWNDTDKAYDLSFEIYDSWMTNLDVSEPVKMPTFTKEYNNAINYYEKIATNSYIPKPEPGWDSHTPEEYRNALLSFYELYAIPVIRTAAVVNAVDGYEGYNSGWTTDSTQFTSALNNYQTVFSDITSLRSEAKASRNII